MYWYIEGKSRMCKQNEEPHVRGKCKGYFPPFLQSGQKSDGCACPSYFVSSVIMTLSSSTIRKFQNTVWHHYRQHGRHDLPWRKTSRSYFILVSEVMLQQTQVNRVIPKYKEFIKTFPTITSLGESPLGEVIRVWQGLGYNRRAMFLKNTARIIVRKYHGRIPRSLDKLRMLPGLGHATASAIMAFAFHQPVYFVETNIRTVYIHHFFPRKGKIHDKEILPLLRETLDERNPREWYYALMDYGASLKRQGSGTNSRSIHYARQPPFHGSRRQMRGKIIRLLATNTALSRRKLSSLLQIDNEELMEVLTQLSREGLITSKNDTYRIPL